MDRATQMIRSVVLVLMAIGFRASHAQDAPFVRDVFHQINTQRQQHGLNRCSYDKKLEKAAQFHAEWMSRNRKMEHLEEEATTFEQQKICNHHPARVLQAPPETRAYQDGRIGKSFFAVSDSCVRPLVLRRFCNFVAIPQIFW